MNNGFNGTGTAFILYILLAFCMPVVYVYRLAKQRRDFGYGFVIGHFFLGLLVTTLAVVCVSYLWRLLAVSKHGELHHILVAMAYFVIAIILTWALIPRAVRSILWLRRKRDILHYHNPHIHPWFVEPYYFNTITATTSHKRFPIGTLMTIIFGRAKHHATYAQSAPSLKTRPRQKSAPRMVDPPFKFPAPLPSEKPLARIVLPPLRTG